MSKDTIHNLPDNYPVSILNMKMKLINKHIKEKEKFNITKLYQEYKGTYNDFLQGGFCFSLKDFKDFCSKNNISEELMNSLVQNQEIHYNKHFLNNDHLKSYKNEDYKDLSDINVFKNYAKEKKGNKSKVNKEKKTIKKFLNKKKKADRQKKAEKENLYSLSKIENERVIFIDLEMPNNPNVLSEGAFIVIDPEEKSEKSYYSVFTEKHNRFVPNTREFSLHNDLKNTEKEYLEILQKEISKSDVVVFHGGHQDRKILRKKGIKFDDKKVVDTQNAIGSISLENAMLKIDPNYKIDISKKDSEKLVNMIESNVPDAKKNKKKYFSNIATHNAYNDTLILANLFNGLLIKQGNASYSGFVKKINENAKKQTLKKLNKKNKKITNN